ncbi:uncharacterized protein N7515_004745 [Penicillium bovifimosum]|uniref:Uncharacterized protein n=1 Tax=Penicillium bovifimosum TaxID=126998 RepID=A0A9W9L468_9EURO|nr:uncharacterized protein N7515_004745 [Penicillium bovifimosum]KAJ5135467.1 hypothetical protein N7515_004745 [Penicillium bovifimosum]
MSVLVGALGPASRMDGFRNRRQVTVIKSQSQRDPHTSSVRQRCRFRVTRQLKQGRKFRTGLGRVTFGDSGYTVDEPSAPYGIVARTTLGYEGKDLAMVSHMRLQK